MLKTTDFDFDLPPELIAIQPKNPRDSSKMLVFGQDQKILDKQVSDLADFLDEGDILVLNDTKVIKAKLLGKRNEAKIEINLHKAIDERNGIWQAFAKPAKRLKIGDKFIISDDFFAQVLNKNEDGIIDLRFNESGEKFFLMLEKYGQMPIPPYIKRDINSKNDFDKDSQTYQTIYARDENAKAVAAPTAGLHFTEELFAKLERKGIKKAFVTLNVGAGTFLPVKSEFVKDHQMHSEYFTINEDTCLAINGARKNGKRVIAVGTTSLRVLESVVDEFGQLKPESRETKIFIYPPYDFKIVDILMTNFHLPKSTLFMLVATFIGKENAFKIYNHAISKQYRFYSFGDTTLLFRSSTTKEAS